MADTTDANVNAAQGDAAEEPDYKALYEQLKADSRKWEQRAKDNKEKADKWDATTKGNESVEDRIAALEAENEAMKAAEARRALVSQVAKETGLSEAIVASLSGTDLETLTEQAKPIAALKPKGAPNVPEAGKFPRGAQKKMQAAQQFGEVVDQLLGH